MRAGDRAASAKNLVPFASRCRLSAIRAHLAISGLTRLRKTTPIPIQRRPRTVKIISFESARVTWLMPLEEFAPASGANSPAVVALIAQRYGFSIVPQITSRDDLKQKWFDLR